MTLLKTRTERDCFTIVTARKRSLGQGNIFRSVCQEFCPHGGGGRAWLQLGMCGCLGGGEGQHVWLPGGMCGCQGACMVAGGCMVVGVCMVAGGHAWLQGVACMVARGHVWLGERAWLWGACVVAGGVHRIRQDTVNERAVRILLECMLVLNCAEFVYFNPSYCF